jgi:hypothetical protein
MSVSLVSAYFWSENFKIEKQTHILKVREGVTFIYDENSSLITPLVLSIHCSTEAEY